MFSEVARAVNKMNNKRVIILALFSPFIAIAMIIFLNVAIRSRIQQQGPYMMCRNFGGETFICHIEWDGNFDNMEFTVPDTFQGRKLTDLGGYYGRGGGYCFRVMTNWQKRKGGYLIARNSWLTDEEISLADTYSEYQFTVNLGKNIRKIIISDFTGNWLLNTVPLGEKQGRGDVEYEIVARISYYFNVDPENKVFYSKDGVVYWKDSNRPVEKLIDSRH